MSQSSLVSLINRSLTLCWLLYFTNTPTYVHVFFWLLSMKEGFCIRVLLKVNTDKDTLTRNSSEKSFVTKFLGKNVTIIFPFIRIGSEIHDKMFVFVFQMQIVCICVTECIFNVNLNTKKNFLEWTIVYWHNWWSLCVSLIGIFFMIKVIFWYFTQEI